MKKILIFCALFALTSCLLKNNQTAPDSIPAGIYKLDKSHASLIFRVNHLGFSKYTARFKRFDAELKFDPTNPAESQVTATIDPTSIETDYPHTKKLNFNNMLQSKQWLSVAQFPKIKFRSTKIELTGGNKARIIGELSLHGISKEVVLDAVFNGGYSEHPMDPSGSRIGFSATGSLNRSDFGIAFGIPEKGTNMGVSDEVEFILEVEFTKPATISIIGN